METKKTTTKKSVAKKAVTKKSAPAKKVASAKSTEATLYSAAAKASGSIALPETVFGVAWNADLVHQVVLAMQANARAGTAHTKDRSEVRGGGKKPWRQKGTGRARHGSRPLPNWVGGGVAHGPTSEKDYSQKINKNVRARALASVLSKKNEDGEIVFTQKLDFSAPKAKDAHKALTTLAGIKGYEGLAGKKQNAALVVLSERDINTEKSFRNFGNVRIAQAKDVNPVDLLTYKHVVISDAENAIAQLEKRVTLKNSRTKAETK